MTREETLGAPRKASNATWVGESPAWTAAARLLILASCQILADEAGTHPKIQSTVYMATGKAQAQSRERTQLIILQTAYKLFCRHGFARVALDTVAEQAKVTKRTLSNHFATKDDLLAAALELDTELAAERVHMWGIDPGLNLNAAIDALFGSVKRQPDAAPLRGGYTRIAMELADLPRHPARAVARKQKAFVETWLAGELGKRGVARPKEHARQIQMLFEGAMALTLIHGDPSYARSAADAAKRLLRQPHAARVRPVRRPSSRSPRARRPRSRG